MSKQATLNISSSLQGKLDKLEEVAKKGVVDKLEEIASDVVRFSPVDTGSYVTSHSFKTNTSSRGRGKSSRGKTPNQNPQAMREAGYQNLMSDIANLELDGLTKITLRNDSPHANYVETGVIHNFSGLPTGQRDSTVDGFNRTQSGFWVYTKVRNKHG